MNHPKTINLCRFVAEVGWLTATPQTFWHIQQSGGLRDHIVDTFCNDTGYVHDQSATTYDAIRARVTKKEICIDCLQEYLDRVARFMPERKDTK